MPLLLRHLPNHDVVVLSDYAKGVLTRVEPLLAQARGGHPRAGGPQGR